MPEDRERSRAFSGDEFEQGCCQLRITMRAPAPAPAGPPLQPEGPSRLVRGTSRAGPSGSATLERYMPSPGCAWLYDPQLDVRTTSSALDEHK